jgi:hypothetical protein
MQCKLVNKSKFFPYRFDASWDRHRNENLDQDRHENDADPKHC